LRPPAPCIAIPLVENCNCACVYWAATPAATDAKKGVLVCQFGESAVS
jgi:hypothetical protein